MLFRLFYAILRYSPLFSDQYVSSIVYSRYFLYSVAYPYTLNPIPLEFKLKLVLGVDGTRCRLGSLRQINSPEWEVSRDPVGLGIIGVQSSDDALLALATKLAQFVPMPQATLYTLFYSGQGILEL